MLKITGILGFAEDLTLRRLFFTNRRMARLSILSLLAILLAGCAEHPEEWVGTYVSTEQRKDPDAHPLLPAYETITITQGVTLRKDGTAHLSTHIWSDKKEHYEGTWEYDNGRIDFYWSMGSGSREQKLFWICKGRHLLLLSLWKRQDK